MQKIQASSSSMSTAEVNEINKFSTNIEGFKKPCENIDLSLFDNLAGFKAKLANISTVGFLGTSYNKEATMPLKREFLQETTKLFSQVSDLLTTAKKTTVTIDPDEVTNILRELCLKIKFYLDIYECYDREFNTLNKVITDLKVLSRIKRAVADKDATLLAEKQQLFPE